MALPSGHRLLHEEDADLKSDESDYVTEHTTEVLRYRAHFSGLSTEEEPWKTSLEDINHEKTSTVPEALFLRESVPL